MSFDELAFGGEWRRYQRLALEAFERDRAARARAAAEDGDWETVVRDVWV